MYVVGTVRKTGIGRKDGVAYDYFSVSGISLAVDSSSGKRYLVASKASISPDSSFIPQPGDVVYQLKTGGFVRADESADDQKVPALLLEVLGY